MKGRRVFANKEHQLAWMLTGGAREIGLLQPIESKRLGGHIAGRAGAESGALARAALKGAERSRQIAAEFQRRRATSTTVGGVTRSPQEGEA